MCIHTDAAWRTNSLWSLRMLPEIDKDLDAAGATALRSHGTGPASCVCAMCGHAYDVRVCV